MPVLFGYFLLVVAFGIFAFYGAGFLIKKWDEAQKKKAERTASQFEEMFIFVRKRILILFYIILPLAVGAAVFIITKNVILGFSVLIVGAFVPIVLVKWLDKRRRKKFISQLVDGLMIMNSSLKGGLTLVQSFEVLAEEMPPPISQEIALLNREIKMGVPLEEGLIRLDKRMPSEEMTLVSSAILVARETGGDLTKVFSRLVETIRDRIKLRELVSTLTIQARLQAIIISLLGPLFVVIVLKVRPDHFDYMLKTDIGRILIAIAVVLQIIGFFLIWLFGRVEI